MTTETPTERPPLTTKQSEVLACIVANQSLSSPTIREIAKHFGFRSPNGVTCHLVALERKGYIRRSHTARGIEVLR